MKIWKGDVLVADHEELETIDASEIYSKRLNAKEVIFLKEKGEFTFPIADGRIKTPGEDQDLRTSTLVRPRPSRGEGHIEREDNRIAKQSLAAESAETRRAPRRSLGDGTTGLQLRPTQLHQSLQRGKFGRVAGITCQLLLEMTILESMVSDPGATFSALDTLRRAVWTKSSVRRIRVSDLKPTLCFVELTSAWQVPGQLDRFAMLPVTGMAHSTTWVPLERIPRCPT